MFWVIFDTSTKRDYYRDVHNLLALPPGTIIRYDYHVGIHSDSAIAEAGKEDRATDVLIAYAQKSDWEKGDASPNGPLAFADALWIATRIARLQFLRLVNNRYYFDLEVRGYPNNNAPEFQTIMNSLAASNDVPFAKWVATSTMDSEFATTANGDLATNWASVINRIGVVPSQFVGDSFWRIAKVAGGPLKRELRPELRPETELVGEQEVQTGVSAVYPVNQLSKLAVRIESRMPDVPGGPPIPEPAVARTVSFVSAPDGLLKDFNGKAVTLRRYGNEWQEAEVATSDRVEPQLVDLAMNTGPAAEAYPIGAEFRLLFEAKKKALRCYWALVVAFIAALSMVGGGLLKDNPAWAFALIAFGIVLGFVAYFLWSGRVKLPSGK